MLVDRQIQAIRGSAPPYRYHNGITDVPFMTHPLNFGRFFVFLRFFFARSRCVTPNMESVRNLSVDSVKSVVIFRVL